MTQCSLGIDIGSVGAKSVLFNGAIMATALLPTGWSPRDSGQQLVELMKGKNGGNHDVTSVIATGYGRNSVDLATRRVTEITCHAKGALFLAPVARTVLDIGGQDSKVILLDATGGVADFAMNDRCAAGTGRFLQMASQALGYSIDDFGQLPADGEAQPISSMCAVFAETELVNHLARGVDRGALVRGIFQSIASRSAAMLGRMGFKAPVFFSGGVSRCGGLVEMVRRELKCDVIVHEQSQFAGALGAAIIGWEGAAR